jgi:hypothetical protein
MWYHTSILDLFLTLHRGQEGKQGAWLATAGHMLCGWVVMCVELDTAVY